MLVTGDMVKFGERVGRVIANQTRNGHELWVLVQWQDERKTTEWMRDEVLELI